MTVQFLHPYGSYRRLQIVELDNATESSLVAQGIAKYAINSGGAWTPLTAVEQQYLRDATPGLLLNMPGAKPTVAALGDSLVQRNFEGGGSTTSWSANNNAISGEGPVTWAMILSQQSMTLTGISGWPGFTIEQIATAGLSDILSAAPNRCVVLAGVNNFASGDTPQQAIDKLRTLIWRPLLAAGIKVDACTCPPNGATSYGWMTQLNEAIRDECRNIPGMKCVDFWRAVANPLTGGFVSTYTSDGGGHWSCRGALYAGLELAAVWADVPPTSTGFGGSFDPLVIGPNSLVQGNTGALGTGASGTVADAWSVSCSGATTVVCAALQARLDRNQGSAMSLACTFAANDDIVTVNTNIVPSTGNIGLGFAWAAATAKLRDDLIYPATSSLMFKAIIPGTTSGAQPTWPVVVGQTVTDNTITWLACERPRTGDIWQIEADCYFTALSGSCMPTLGLRFFDGSFVALNIAQIMFGTTVNQSPAGALSINTSFAGLPFPDYLPLNTRLRIRSLPFILPATLVFLRNTFSVIGKAGTTATCFVERIEMRRVKTW